MIWSSVHLRYHRTMSSFNIHSCDGKGKGTCPLNKWLTQLHHIDGMSGILTGQIWTLTGPEGRVFFVWSRSVVDLHWCLGLTVQRPGALCRQHDPTSAELQQVDSYCFFHPWWCWAVWDQRHQRLKWWCSLCPAPLVLSVHTSVSSHPNIRGL